MYIGTLYHAAIMWPQNGIREEIGDIAGMFCTAWGIPGKEN